MTDEAFSQDQAVPVETVPVEAVPVEAVPVERQTPPVPSRQGWAKPALVGGIIGALISGGITGGAVLATRQESSDTATAAIATSVAALGTSQTGSASAGDKGVASSSSNLKRAYEHARASVVSINTKGFDPRSFIGVEPSSGAGSGIVISKGGLILTNNHVIENATSIKVTFADRSQKTATLVGTDPANDVALLKVSGVSNLAAATLGKSSSLEVGDPVVAIGNALALPGGPTVTTGIVSALGRQISDETAEFKGLIQTDAAINPGNSGGPLVNLAGDVVGMNTAIIQNSNNIGFAIAIDRIKPIIDDLQKSGSTLAATAFLGVVTQTVTAQLKSEYDLPVDKGVLVIRVEPGSPAENIGLQPGDVITEFNTKTLTSAEQLGSAVRGRKPGDKVDIVWRRADEIKTAAAELGARGIVAR